MDRKQIILKEFSFLKEYNFNFTYENISNIMDVYRFVCNYSIIEIEYDIRENYINFKIRNSELKTILSISYESLMVNDSMVYISKFEDELNENYSELHKIGYYSYKLFLKHIKILTEFTKRNLHLII